MNITEETTTRELNSVKRTRRVVDSAVWCIAGAAILFSLATGTPFVADHSRWKWTGWVLPAAVDAALVLSLSADSILSRHGVKSSKWPTVFRWLTATASIYLNCWSSLSTKDWTSAVVHSIAPLILVCAAEVAPVYRVHFRQVELSLTAQTEEFTVARAVATQRKRSAPQESKSSEPVIDSTTSSEPELTDRQRAIKDGFLSGKKAGAVAKEIGVSPSYVYTQYRRIKDELSTAA